MTSSLVGSEMCIRDSLSDLPICPFADSSRSLDPANLSNLPICRSDRPASPVSYTHLTLPTICSV
eukprot:9926607-Prorocentrum_lima.AAC.1